MVDTAQNNYFSLSTFYIHVVQARCLGVWHCSILGCHVMYLCTFSEIHFPSDKTMTILNHLTTAILHDTIFAGFKYELALVLSGIAPIPNLASLERQVMQSLQQPPPLSFPCPHWTPKRSGTSSKSHYIYFLLDPRKADRVQIAVQQANQLESFRAFVDSVFYVGKGKNSRAMPKIIWEQRIR